MFLWRSVQLSRSTLNNWSCRHFSGILRYWSQSYEVQLFRSQRRENSQWEIDKKLYSDKFVIRYVFLEGNLQVCLDMAWRSAHMPTLLNILGTCVKHATTMKGGVPKPDPAGSTTEVPSRILGVKVLFHLGIQKSLADGPGKGYQMELWPVWGEILHSWFASDRLLQRWIPEGAYPGLSAIVGILYTGTCAGFEVGDGDDLFFCPITAWNGAGVSPECLLTEKLWF